MGADIIKTFNETGICEVHVDRVVDAWNDRFSISQYNDDDEYKIIKQVELFKEDAWKVTISKEQAAEIIDKLKLLPIQSSFFTRSKTWRSENSIISEKNRIENILNEKLQEIKVIRDIIGEFNSALAKK